MSNRLKVTLAIVLAVVVVVGLAAYRNNSTASPTTVHVWYETDDPVEQAWAQHLAGLFNQTHKSVKADMKVWSYDDFNPKMQLALGAGTPPDLAYATPRMCAIPLYVQSKKLANLTSYARQYHWAQQLRPGLLQDYNSPFALYATQKYGVQPKNVPVYAVPDAMAAVGMMYNVKLLHRLHLGIPKSLSQLEHDIAVTKKAGYTPLGLGNADGWLGDDWYQTLANTQYTYADLERELRVDPHFKFQRPAFVAMARLLDSWKGDFTHDFAGLDAQDGVVSFFKGKTLFQLISSTENAQIQSLQRQTHLPINVFPFPGATTKSMPVMAQSGYEGWIIPKAGHNEKAAIEFINWVLQPAAKKFLLAQGVLPSEPTTAAQGTTGWQKSYLQGLNKSRAGVFLDAAPILNLNATMEANVSLLLYNQQIETPQFLPHAMQIVYNSLGKKHGQIPDIDCEF